MNDFLDAKHGIAGRAKSLWDPANRKHYSLISGAAVACLGSAQNRLQNRHSCELKSSFLGSYYKLDSNYGRKSGPIMHTRLPP